MQSKEWAIKALDKMGDDMALRVSARASRKWYKVNGEKILRNPNWQFFYDANCWIHKIIKARGPK